MKRCFGGFICFSFVSDLRWGGLYLCERIMFVIGFMVFIDFRRSGRRGVIEFVIMIIFLCSGGGGSSMGSDGRIGGLICRC